MNKNIKKILTTALVSTAALSIIGCGAPNAKLAKSIDKGMADFVSSINTLDYVDSQTKTGNLGKIVETQASGTAPADSYLNKTFDNITLASDIVSPTSREDNFKLFVLSESPFISLTSNDENIAFNIQLNFSTNKISETSENINEKINTLILKRSILMIYVNEIYNNRVNLSDENRVAINAYINVLKENTSYLNGNRGMVKNQLNLANDIISSNTNNNLVNYYMIKSGEALETRSNKIDSSISAIDSIIEIIENNLSTNSLYHGANLSETYKQIMDNIQSESATATTENKELADSITSALSFEKTQNFNSKKAKTSELNQATKNNKSLKNKNSNNLNSAQENNISTLENSTSKNQTQKENQNQNSVNIKNKSLNLQNEKSANLGHFDENSALKQPNIENFDKNNQSKHEPKTLEIPQIVENENQSKTSNFRNKKHNLRKNRTTKRTTSTQNSSSTSVSTSQKNSPSIIQSKDSHEQIKRVPYIRNFD